MNDFFAVLENPVFDLLRKDSEHEYEVKFEAQFQKVKSHPGDVIRIDIGVRQAEGHLESREIELKNHSQSNGKPGCVRINARDLETQVTDIYEELKLSPASPGR